MNTFERTMMTLNRHGSPLCKIADFGCLPHSGNFFLFGLLLALFGPLSVVGQIGRSPVQRFNSGWEFTAVKLTGGDGASKGIKRGLGNNWSDQFNVQQVDQSMRSALDTTMGLQQMLGTLKEAAWQKVELPHTAFMEPVPIEHPKEGFAYYRKRFTVPAALKGKRLQLQFDGAMQVTEVWLNGKFALRHLGGYLPFAVDLTDNIAFGQENTLFIRVDNRANPLVPPGKPVRQLDFIYYSGLYRDVWLYVNDPLHITLPQTMTKTGGGGVFVHYEGAPAQSAVGSAASAAGTETTGKITIRTNIINQDHQKRSFTITQRLLDHNGDVAGSWSTGVQQLLPGEDSTVKQAVNLQKPHLWNLEDPYLYTLITKIKSGRHVIDECRTKVGLRTVEITRQKGLLINGEPVHINGSNRHMNYPWIGNALSDNANLRDAILIKKAGINAIRLGHYPQDPSFYAACDSLGILLVDCIPGWQFFNKSDTFKALVMRDIQEMIRRDRNHPSVFLWETSLNESYPPREFRVLQSEVAHKEWMDSTGFYTSGDSYFTKAAWDVPYDDWNGDPGARNNTTYPESPFLVREYGDYEFGGGQSTSRKSRGDGQMSLLQQAWNLQWEHNRNQIHYPRCIGDMTWAFFDGLAGVTNVIESWGLADLYRIPKFSYYFFKSQNRRQPMVYIADYWEAGGHTDSLRRVIVYGNGDSVRLSVNGSYYRVTQHPDAGPDKPYGTTLDKGGLPFTGGDASHLLSPPFTFVNVPFQKGSLKAESFRDGKVVASDQVYTAGSPVRIKLSVDDQGVPLKADGADAVFVRAILLDADGHPVYSSDSTSRKSIHFRVRGNARIVSPAERTTEAGIGSILVQATGQSGEIIIEAVSPGIKTAELRFKSR